MEIDKKIEYIFFGILILIAVFFLIRLNQSTIAQKIAFVLMIIDVAILLFYKISDKDAEGCKKAKRVRQITLLIGFLFLIFMTYDFAMIWHELPLSAKIGIVLIDLSSTMMIMITLYSLNKRNLI